MYIAEFNDLHDQAIAAGYEDGYDGLKLHAQNKYSRLANADVQLALNIVILEHQMDADFSSPTARNFPMAPDLQNGT